MSKLYDFTIGVCGWGESPEEAWEACKENFNIDKMEIADYEISDENEDEINFENWNKIELYDYLVALYEIDPESDVNNWDRIDLLKIAKNVEI